MEYALLEPDALVRAVEMLQEQGKAAGDPPHSGLVGRLGTSRWTGSSTPGASRLLDAERLVKSLPSGPGRLGPAEGAVEASIQGWKAGLRVLAKSESAAELDGGGVALLERWYRRALYRDLGLLALSDDDAEFALVALEEAAEARGRVRPGPGLDPLLLAGLAHARYKSNELQRSVVLLEDMAQIPGWEVAGFAAQTVARVAVLGSTADAKVNR